ncbi:hypothetical protein ACQPZF_15380 [Actinosynnema sp. CS-041913]|uniref:hypothetical protein n=1 Tax=Actinosynnema sp. CS-041913 TaxID=3239917 RepID=UPI003D902FA7
MTVGPGPVESAVECARKLSAGPPPSGSAAEALDRLLASNGSTAQALERLRTDPADLDPLRAALQDALRDNDFAAALVVVVERVRFEEAVTAPLPVIRQSAHISGTVTGRATINQAGRDVVHAGHIGDRIQHIHRTRNGRIGLAAVGVVVVAVVAAFLVTPDDEAPANVADRSTTATTTTASTVTTTRPAVPSGAALYAGKDDVLVESNGRVVVVSDRGTGYDGALTTIDIATGEVVGQVALPSSRQASLRCKYTVVKGERDLVVSFEQSVTAAKGTAPTVDSRTLVARDARTGREVWRTEPRTKSPAGQTADESYTACGGEIPPKALTADGRFAWIAFFPNDDPFAVDLTTGRMRPQPGRVVVGNHIGVPGPPSTTVYGSPEFMDLVDPADGAVDGRVADPQLAGSVEAGFVLVTSDGKAVVHGSPTGTALRDLPGQAVRWEQARLDKPLVGDVPTGTLVHGWPAMTGRKLDTGAEVWNVAAYNYYCGTQAGRIYLIANGQFAVLDLATGRQLGYDAALDECPRVLPGVMEVGGKVTKL